MAARPLAFALFAAGLVLAACERAAATDPIAQAEAAAAVGRADAPLFLDVRTPAEYAAGRVPGAVNVPIDELPARVAELEAHRAKEVVVYCERGPRASRAEEALESAGFTSVRRLEGDMSGWRGAGLPVER
jgi:rhodanese-related sulfurtransferase